jgi:anthranilate phosphoribosyltransferase
MTPNQASTEILSCLLARRDLAEEQIRSMITEMITGGCIDTMAAALLVAMRMKGETATEIAHAAQVLRDHMIRWDTGVDNAVDTCGTGGDGAGTFNISTASAMVAAGAGAKVVKHGNRSVSSKSGSADVLAKLGVKIDGDSEFARRCLRESNFAFCFAPQFHPALKNVAAVRRMLGVPTIFNSLGPLANPAGATRQIIGVGRLELLDLLSEALRQLGTQHALVIFSTEGLDEVSLSGKTLVREIREGKICNLEWTSTNFGLESCVLAELSAPHADASAGIIREVLEGRSGAPERIVLANAAAALVAAGIANSLADGVERARESIHSRAALRVLHALQELSAREPQVNTREHGTA